MSSDPADIIRDFYKQAQVEQSTASFENRCVERMLQIVKFPRPLSVLRSEHIRHSGKRSLDLTWFQEYFPAFPAELVCDRLTNLSDISWTTLFGRGFEQQPWFKQYLGHVDDGARDLEDTWFALIFQVPHADKASLMVVHSKADALAVPTADKASYTKIVRWVSKLNSALVVEPLQSFLASTGSRWYENALDN